jgi:RimJ/RimL family protein N-acetyltransferase
MRFYPRPFRREDVEGWIGRVRDRYVTDGFGLLGVVERETGELVGDCGPMRMEVDGAHHTELGWHVRPDRQRRGYASEAGAACRDRAFAELDPPRLISLIRPENVPSWRVARRLGFTPWRSTVRVGMAHIVWSLDQPGRV